MNAGFKCNLCGKCCNSSPSLTISEVFEFQDDFISIITLHPSVVTNPTIFEKRDLRNMGREGQILLAEINADDNNTMFLSIEAGFMTYYKNNKCQMLEKDGRCKLHIENRVPLSCNSVPLRVGVTAKEFPKFIKKNRCFKWCVKFDPYKPNGLDMVLENGEFNEDSPLVKSLRIEDEVIKEDRKSVIDPNFYQMLGQNVFESLGLSLSDIVNTCLSHSGDISMHISPFLLFGDGGLPESYRSKIKNKYISSLPRVIEFYEHQVVLINKAFDEGVAPSYKQELSEILQHYETAIASYKTAKISS